MVKRFFKIAAAILSVAVVYGGLSFFLVYQSSRDDIRIRNFYREPKDSLNVVLIGGSTVQTDYSSALAWNEFGYTGYSMSVASVRTLELKPLLKEVRKRQKDALILVDLGCVYYEDQNDDITLRRLLDNMPFFNKTRFETINERIPRGERIYYYFPLATYHNNWKDKESLLTCINYSLENLDIIFNRDRLSMRGITGIARQYPAEIYVDYEGNTDSAPLYPDAEKYLRDFCEYCVENGENNILFVRMPRYYNEKRADEYLMINEAMNIVSEYGYTGINYDSFISEIGLITDEDFQDQTHMNIYGQEKFTKYLGQYLVDNYFINRVNHDDEVIKAWDEEYRIYQELYKIISDDMPLGKEETYDYTTLIGRVEG